MSAIVSGVLKHTVGFLANKIRKEVAQRLEDGDVTDEECRRLIVTEIDDIKSKLDGLARKDLLSSLCFLQEGVNRLYQSLLQFPTNENTAESTDQATLVEVASSRDTGSPSSSSPIHEAVALTNAISSLKLHSNERFKFASKSFELSREKATEAFCNEALSIEDRIQACQIRMIARILENLEDPDASVSDCMQYLKQLHDLGAIRQLFYVLVNGGIKSRFNRTKRLNIASTVEDMNQMLFDLSRKFTKLSLDTIDWPTVLIGKDVYNPLLKAKRPAVVLVENLYWFDVELPSRFTFTGREIDPSVSVVNSEGHIIAKFCLFEKRVKRSEQSIKIFKRSGKSSTLFRVPMEHTSEWHVIAMDIDIADNMYVITAFRESDERFWSFKLFIFDRNGNKKIETPLSFLENFARANVCMAVNKDGRIAIFDYKKKTLYFGNVFAEMKSVCLEELDTDNWLCNIYIRFSDSNGRKIIVNGFRTVYIFTENGQLQNRIEIPNLHRFIVSFTINHLTKHILVKTYSSVLLCYSESGKLIYSVCLGSSKWIINAQLISHPNGPIALVSDDEAGLLDGSEIKTFMLKERSNFAKLYEQ